MIRVVITYKLVKLENYNVPDGADVVLMLAMLLYLYILHAFSYVTYSTGVIRSFHRRYCIRWILVEMVMEA